MNRHFKYILLLFIPFIFMLAIPSCSPKLKTLSGEEPVEPLVTGKEALLGEPFWRGRFSVLNPEMKIFTLSVSRGGENILFSSESRTISRLDDQGNLCWEITSEGLPICAALTEDGRFAGVGTDQGKVYFLDDAGQILWELSFEGKIEHLVFNKKGDQLLLSVLEEEKNTLRCLNRLGSLLWEMETGLLIDLYPASGEEIFFLEEESPDNKVFKIAREGEPLWEKDAQLAAVSAGGDYFALFDGGELQCYRLGKEGYPLQAWSAQPGSDKEISWLGLTGEGRYLLAYNAFAVGNNNLWAFNSDGFLLWEKKIPSGALLDFSFSGEKIVASSWQEYSEDVSKIIIMNNYGHVLQEIEMASRIEKNALSGDGNILVLAGGDGNLFILETTTAGGLVKNSSSPEEGEQAKTIYQPVTFGKQEGENFLTLYFFDEEALNLVPVNRRVKASPQGQQTAINELTKGPRSSSGLSRTIPKEVHIDVEEQGGILYVSLPAKLDKLCGSTQLQGLIDSLVLTLSQFPAVHGIQFLLDGQEVTALGGEGLLIDKIFPPRRFGQKPILYLPYRSDNRYYLLPREAAGPMELIELVNEVLRESDSFLPVKPYLKEIRMQGKEVVLNWEASFAELFPPTGGAKERALAELFTDALLLTLGENFSFDRLVLQIEGDPWRPPEGYHYCEKISHPFFINPE